MFNLFGTKCESLPMEQGVKEAGHNPAIRLVDVRTREEYRQGHLPGSLNLPLDELSLAEKALPDKQAPLYVYCLSGARSGMACRALLKRGYARVVNIGGIGGYRGHVESGSFGRGPEP